jgi:hypothetical protein
MSYLRKESGKVKKINISLRILVIFGTSLLLFMFNQFKNIITFESGYNDIGLCDTSPIASDILWYQLIPHC